MHSEYKMSAPRRLVDRRLAKLMTYSQAAMIPVAALIGWLLFGQVGAKSAFIGAGLYWLGSAYLAWQAFRYSGARASKQILNRMYAGLMGKFLIITVGFVLMLLYVSPLKVEAALIGFVLVQLIVWIAPFLDRQINTI